MIIVIVAVIIFLLFYIFTQNKKEKDTKHNKFVNFFLILGSIIISIILYIVNSSRSTKLLKIDDTKFKIYDNERQIESIMSENLLNDEIRDDDDDNDENDNDEICDYDDDDDNDYVASAAPVPIINMNDTWEDLYTAPGMAP